MRYWVKGIASTALVAALTAFGGVHITISDQGEMVAQGLQAQASERQRQAFEAGFAGAIAQALRNPAAMDEILLSMQVPESHRGVYLDHLQRGWGNEAVLAAFAEDLFALASSIDLNDRELVGLLTRNFSAAWFMEKAITGIRRLEASDQRAFFEASLRLMESVPPSLCAAMVREETSAPEMAEIEIQYMAQQPREYVRGYLSILRKAVIAEVGDYPPKKSLGTSERMIVEEVLYSRLMNKLAHYPDQERLLAGLENYAFLTDEELCSINNSILRIVLSEPGQVGQWMLRYMIQ